MDDVHPAGIRREIAADRAGACRREPERELPSRLVGGGARGIERHAGFDDHRVGGRIHFTHGVHAGQRKDDGIAFHRGLASDEAGVAALRHDGGAGLVTEREDGRDLLARLWPHDAAGAAFVEVARLAEIGSDVRRHFDDVGGADNGAQAREEVVGRRGRAGGRLDGHRGLLLWMFCSARETGDATPIRSRAPSPPRCRGRRCVRVSYCYRPTFRKVSTHSCPSSTCSGNPAIRQSGAPALRKQRGFGLSRPPDRKRLLLVRHGFWRAEPRPWLRLRRLGFVWLGVGHLRRRARSDWSGRP